MCRAFSPHGLWLFDTQAFGLGCDVSGLWPFGSVRFPEARGLCCFCVDSKIHRWYLCGRYLTCHVCHLKNLRGARALDSGYQDAEAIRAKGDREDPSCAASQMTGSFRMDSSIYFRHQKSRGFKVRKIHWQPGFARKLSTNAEPRTLSGGVR